MFDQRNILSECAHNRLPLFSFFNKFENIKFVNYMCADRLTVFYIVLSSVVLVRAIIDLSMDTQRIFNQNQSKIENDWFFAGVRVAESFVGYNKEQSSCFNESVATVAWNFSCLRLQFCLVV